MERTKRALVVDDEETWRRRISKALGREGFEVRAVGSYDAALDELRCSQFDLVTVDMNFYIGDQLQNTAGDDLLDDIKREFGNIPCIVISGSEPPPEETGKLFQEYGIVGIIEKVKFGRKKLQRLVEDATREDEPVQPVETHRQTSKPVEKSQSIKILFFGANPSDTTRLRLDEEVRGIDQAIRQAEFRDKFDIKQHWAVRVTDLQGYLLRHKPDIVHFSGHGSESSEIILLDNSGRAASVSALGRLFSVLKDNIRCVVLNACYSEQQARAIAEHIDCVIGMSKQIGDSAAISFAVAFYRALGYGRDVKTAFELGCLQIDLENLGEQDTPKLLATINRPEEIFFAFNSW